VPETVLSVRVAEKSEVIGLAVRDVHSVGKKSNLQMDTLCLT